MTDPTVLLLAIAILSPASATDTNACAQASAHIVVTASRLDQTTEEMPSRVEVFTSHDFNESGATTLSDFLAKGAHLTIRTLNANPFQGQIALRGYGENSFGRCKVLLDGEELNSVDMQAPDLMRVSLDQIERIEILYGPQTVLHGDGASAGVINVVTAHTYEPVTRLTVRGGSQGTIDTSVRRTGGDEERGIAYKAAYEYLRSDGVRDNSGYQTHIASASLRKSFSNGAMFGAKANYTWQECQLPGACDELHYRTNPDASTHDNDWFCGQSYGVALETKAVLNDENNLCVDLGFAQKHRHTEWGDYGYADDSTLHSVRLNPRLINETTVFEHENQFVCGLDATCDHYMLRNGNAELSSDPFFDRFRLAGYMQDEFFLTDELSLVAGTRLEEAWNNWHHCDNLCEPRKNTFLWACELGSVYRPWEGLKTYAKTSRFYRQPFCDEMNYVPDGESLDPESGYGVDLGADFAINDEWRVFVNGYGSWTHDEIFYDPYHTPTAWGWSGYNCNAPGTTQRLGFDTGGGWSRKKVAHLTVKYGFVNARFASGEYEGSTVPLVPASRLRAEAGYWVIRELQIRFGTQVVGEQRFGSDFKNEAGWLSSRATCDCGIVYEPERWGLDGLSVSLGFDNLFDTRYCDYAGYSNYSGTYYYPAAGRTFALTVTYEF